MDLFGASAAFLRGEDTSAFFVRYIWELLANGRSREAAQLAEDLAEQAAPGGPLPRDLRATRDAAALIANPGTRAREVPALQCRQWSISGVAELVPRATAMFTERRTHELAERYKRVSVATALDYCGSLSAMASEFERDGNYFNRRPRTHSSQTPIDPQILEQALDHLNIDTMP